MHDLFSKSMEWLLWYLRDMFHAIIAWSKGTFTLQGIFSVIAPPCKTKYVHARHIRWFHCSSTISVFACLGDALCFPSYPSYNI